MKDIATVIANLTPEKRAQFFSKLGNKNKDSNTNGIQVPSKLQGDFAIQFRSTRPFDFEESSFKLPDPAENFIQVEAKAVSLNFRDLMIASRLYSSSPGVPSNMGSDYAGVVVKTGKNVRHVKEGDEVIALAAGHAEDGKVLENYHFSKYVNVHKDCVTPKPVTVDFLEASCIPTAFLTTYIGLIHMARLSPDDTILIHTATGGVGLSAIQVARSIGANIFATAGTPEKREFLKSYQIEHIMDSRSLDFEEEIMRISNNEGIDVVFNTLSADAVDAGLRLLKPFGRFIHIDKKDIASNKLLPMGLLSRGLTLFYLDIAMLFFKREFLQKSLINIVSHFDEGKFRYPDYKVYPIQNFKKALTDFSHSTHIGKFVLSY